MLVHIVYVPDAQRRNPDLTRVGKVEDLPDELGRMMLADGTGREPTDEERADWEATREAAESRGDTPPVEVGSPATLPDSTGSGDVPATDAAPAEAPEGE